MTLPGGQYEIDFFRKMLVFRKMDEQLASKSRTLRRLDVLKVATGSYMVEWKCIGSRKVFKRVPGFQDVRSGSKRVENVRNRKTSIFSSWVVFSVCPSVGVGRRECPCAHPLRVEKAIVCVMPEHPWKVSTSFHLLSLVYLGFFAWYPFTSMQVQMSPNCA